MPLAKVAVVLPARDASSTIAETVDAYFCHGASRVVVVTDPEDEATASRAWDAGAEIVTAPERAHGAATLAGIAHLADSPPDVLVLASPTHAPDPGELPFLAAELAHVDVAVGHRARRAPAARQRLEDAVVRAGLRALFGIRVQGVPPLVALRWGAIERLQLREREGLPVEAVAMAARRGLTVREVPDPAAASAARAGAFGGASPGSLMLLSLVVRLRFRKLA